MPEVKPITANPEALDLTVLMRTRLEQLSRRVRDALHDDTLTQKKLQQYVGRHLQETDYLLSTTQPVQRLMRDHVIVDRLISS